MAEQIREILIQEQDHQIAAGKDPALGIEVRSGHMMSPSRSREPEFPSERGLANRHESVQTQFFGIAVLFAFVAGNLVLRI